MRWGWIAALAALLAAAPVQADITARFAQESGPPITVQVRDNGDSRIVVTDGVYVMRDGVAYMILTDPRGTFVTRQEDFVALMQELLTAVPRLPGARDPVPGVEEQGTETVAGRTGTIFRVGAPGSTDTIDFVISEDPELAPVGRAMATLLGPLLTASMESTPGLGAEMTGLFARGTVIRFGFMWRLDSVDMAPVAAAGFELPSAPIGREAVRARFLGPEADPN